jgi:4'-phosphopantetheinyl transferase EntD
MADVKTIDDWKALSQNEKIALILSEKEATFKAQDDEQKKAIFLAAKSVALKAFDEDAASQISDLTVQLSKDRTALEQKWAETGDWSLPV